MTSLPTVIDLFSGCGGLSTGLLDAGYNVALGVDNDAPSLVAFDYNHNYRGCRSLLADVEKLSGSELLEAAELEKLDVLAGGPPCQPFSIAGKKLGWDDPRGHLVNEFVRIVSEVKPKAVLFENVPALARAHDGEVLNKLVLDLENCGYTVASGILNSADYGVPQARKRLIVLAINSVEFFPFPPLITHSANGHLFGEPHVTCKEAIDDLPNVTDPASHSIPNHEPTDHTPAMLEVFANLKPGRRDPGSYHDRLHPDRPAYTLRAGSGNFSPLRPVHYKYDRVITVRESARLQGFNDHFMWPDSLARLQQYRQVGNAVPVPLARAIGEHLAHILSWELSPEDVCGVPEGRPIAVAMSADERQARRKRFQRGGAAKQTA